MTISSSIIKGKNPQRYCIDARFKIGRFGAGAANLIIQDMVDGDLIRMPDRVMDALDAKYLVRPIHYNRLHREEPLELPEKGLREIICNAIIHKQYDGPDIQMRVYDDRIDLWNFGKLPEGYTFEQMFQPHRSMPRNKLIANAFFYAGLIEAWGRGFEIITNEFTKEGLAVPTFKEEFGGVTATIKREIFLAIKLGHNKGDDLDEPVNELVTAPVLAQEVGVSISTIKRELKALIEGGWIKHFGPDKSGRWLIIKK